MKTRMVQSQPASKGSEVRYHWVCLFNWDEHDPEPFVIHVREATVDYIPSSWFSKPIEERHRQQKARFDQFQGKIMSVFCKIEESK